MACAVAHYWSVAISVFDLFSIGIGPSSSHTVGPMRAARTFALGLADAGRLDSVVRVRAELFGSLGATGHGHGSDRAVILGLMGEQPESVDTSTVLERVAAVKQAGVISLLGKHDAALIADDLILHRRTSLPFHPNGMRFFAFGADDVVLSERTFYSVGGGFVIDESATGADKIKLDDTPLTYPFTTGAALLDRCAESGLPISGVMLANEQAWRTEDEIRSGLLTIWSVMQQCVQSGWSHGGTLPGGLKVRRRAPELYRRLCDEQFSTDPLRVMDWVDLFALAVNEENAAGGRVVTAPTNGAAGVVPAVLHYYKRFVPGRVGRRCGSVPALRCRDRSALQRERVDLRGPRSGVRVRSARRAPWPPVRSAKSWVGRLCRSRTPPRSVWSTTSA